MCQWIPTFPRRTAFLVEDAKTPVVLTQKKLADVLPGIKARMIYLDTPEYHQSAMEMPDANPERKLPRKISFMSFIHQARQDGPKGWLSNTGSSSIMSRA